MVMTIEDQIRLIAAKELNLDFEDVTMDTRIETCQAITNINDEACIALNLNIGAVEASNCITVGAYADLVKDKLNG